MLMNPEETCPTCLEFSSPCRLPIAPESSLHPETLLGLSSRTHSWTRSRSPPGADVGANPPSLPWHWATVCNIWGYRIFAYFYEDFLQGGAWHLFRKPGSLQKLNQRVSLGRHEPSIFGVHIYTDVPDTGGSVHKPYLFKSSKQLSKIETFRCTFFEKTDVERGCVWPEAWQLRENGTGWCGQRFAPTRQPAGATDLPPVGLLESASHSELARRSPSDQQPIGSVQRMRNAGSLPEPGSELRRWAEASLTHSSYPNSLMPALQSWC